MSIFRSIQHLGLGPYSVYLLGRLLRCLSLGDAVHYCIMSVDLEAILHGLKAKECQPLVALAAEDKRLDALDAPSDVVKQRLFNGADCLALVQKNTPRAWIWHQREAYVEDEVRATFVIPGAAVWDFGAYVVPRYRLGRSFEHLWTGFAKSITDEGQSHSLSRIATHNTASLNAHSRLPHRILGHCTFIRVLGIQVSFSPLLESWHISRNDADMPVFQLTV